METIRVEFGDRSYDIRIEGGSLPGLGTFVAGCAGRPPRKVCVATTETVAGLYLDIAMKSLSEAGFEVSDIVVPDGEEYKTLDTFKGIVTRLIERRFERTSVLVPLGGGVIGDTAGFAAAALLRGLPFVQVPTTIVAQVDSSIGGKVAVNHPLGKNLVGHFYQPRGVFIDTRVLSTLEAREVVSGMAETAKHAIIRDAAFFAFLEEHVERIMSFEAPDDVMERFIAWNCRIKADVVSADEREGGVRAVLNYGHTVGHAVETVTGYTRFRHGEAVMLGMIAAGRIAVVKGILPPEDFDRQNRLLDRIGVRRDFDGITTADLLDAMTRDKKVTDGRIRFILPRTVGSVEIRDDVTQDEMEDGIRFMLGYIS